MSIIQPKYLTPEQHAELRQCSMKTLERERCDGTGPTYIRSRGRVLYDIEDVQAWLDSRKVQSTAETLEG